MIEHLHDNGTARLHAAVERSPAVPLVEPDAYVETLRAQVDSSEITDAEFRDHVRRSIGGVRLRRVKAS